MKPAHILAEPSPLYSQRHAEMSYGYDNQDLGRLVRDISLFEHLEVSSERSQYLLSRPDHPLGIRDNPYCSFKVVNCADLTNSLPFLQDVSLRTHFPILHFISKEG